MTLRSSLSSFSPPDIFWINLVTMTFGNGRNGGHPRFKAQKDLVMKFVSLVRRGKEPSL
jgi:hypothetical protein